MFLDLRDGTLIAKDIIGSFVPDGPNQYDAKTYSVLDKRGKFLGHVTRREVHDHMYMASVDQVPAPVGYSVVSRDGDGFKLPVVAWYLSKLLPEYEVTGPGVVTLGGIFRCDSEFSPGSDWLLQGPDGALYEGGPDGFNPYRPE